MSANAPTEAPAASGAKLRRERGACARWGILGLLCLAFIAAYFDRVNLSVAITRQRVQQLLQR